MVNISKTQIAIIVLSIAVVVCAVALTYFLAPATFFAFIGAVDAGLFLAMSYLPLLAMSYGTLALLGMYGLGFALSAAIWHYGVEKWWIKKQEKKQPAIAQTITMQREPAPEQQPSKTTIPPPITTGK